MQIMRFAFGLVIIVVLAGCSAAQSEHGTTAAPPSGATLCVNSTEHDFGIVQPRDVLLSHTFELQNQSAAPVDLKLLHKSCNCVAVRFPDSIAPETTAKVAIDMELGTREGPVGQEVILGTSDPAHETIRFVFKADVVRPVVVEPAELLLSDVLRGETVEHEIRVIRRIRQGSASPQPVTLTPAIDAIRTEYVDTTMLDAQAMAPGVRILVDRYRVFIDSAQLDGAESQQIPNALQVDLGALESPVSMDIPLVVRFRHHSALRGPTSLVGDAGVERRELVVPVWSRDQTPFSITNVSCSLPQLQVREFTPEPAARHEIVVAVAGDGVSSARDAVTGQVEVFTDKWPHEPFRVSVVVLPAR